MNRITFGRRVQVLRKQKGLSQRELAASVGAHIRNISSIERGLSLPVVGLAWRIAQTLGVTLDELCDEPEAANA